MSFETGVVRQWHFHDIHGSSLLLKKNNTIACRTDGFNNGIAFTYRPVMILEPVVFQITDTSKNWSGALRIGFTIHDPSEMRGKIPAHSTPDLISTYGNWAKALPESTNNTEYLLAFHVDINGDVYYAINDEEKRFLLSGVDTSSKLWGIIDVYGNTVEVELLGTGSSQAQVDLEEMPSSKEAKSLKIAFHKIHGRHVNLTKDRTIAYRKQRSGYYAYVFSNRPFKFHEKIIVEVNTIEKAIKGPLEYGLTSSNPAEIDPKNLPKETDDLVDFPDYWVIHEDKNYYKTGDIIIFSITVEGKFIVLKNGSSRTCFLHVDISQPLWLFIKLSGTISEICMKNVSTKDYCDIMTAQRLLQLSAMSINDDEEEDGSDDPESSACASSVESSSPKDECLICCEKPVNCVLYRCGHMCMCYECAQNMWRRRNEVIECPICRTPIQDVIKTYS